MTKLLERTLATVQKFPDQEQDAIAMLILEDEALLKVRQAADGDELLTKE